MLILGINDGHTAAVCLYQDGQARASQTTTNKAIAAASAMADSDVASAIYTLKADGYVGPILVVVRLSEVARS